MKTIILVIASLLASTAYADECYQKVITVCKTKGKVKKKVKVIPGPLIVYKDRVVEKVVVKHVPVPVLSCPGCPPEGVAVVGGHFALGLGVQDPYVSGMIGLRVRFPKAWVGFEVFSALQYGVGFQTLFYPYQGRVVKLHIIDPGVLITGSPFHLLGDKDIQRRVDLLLGAGVEVKLTCHLALTVDWRVGIPNPVTLYNNKDCNGCNSQRIDIDRAVGNAFASSQVFVGLLFHN